MYLVESVAWLYQWRECVEGWEDENGRVMTKNFNCWDGHMKQRKK
jgi:hypothetical protein